MFFVQFYSLSKQISANFNVQILEIKKNKV